MARFERVQSKAAETVAFQENVARAVEPLLGNPLLQGHVLPALEFSAGVAQDVSHGLGRACIGWVPVNVTSALPAGWTAPTLLNSTVNLGLQYGPAGYWLDGQGVLHLRGIVKSWASPYIFVLPVGYRPPYDMGIAVVSNDAFGEIAVHTNGDVLVIVGNTAWLSLDGVSFPVTTSQSAPFVRSASPDEGRLLRLTSSASVSATLYVF